MTYNKKYRHEYYLKHRAQQAEYERNYRKTHKERLRTYGKLWKRANRPINRDKWNAAQRKWYVANKDTVRYQQRLWYQANREKLCAELKRKRRLRPEHYRAINRRWNFRHKMERAERQRKSSFLLRSEMISAYGGCCTCCGEKTMEFLTLEHLNNDGAAHRKKVGYGRGTWVDLKRRGWPKDGYTVRCWNCNWGRRLAGQCPHTKAQ